MLAGTTDFQVGGLFPEGFNLTAASILLLLFAFGIGKAALMPIHPWLPNAMVAPTPVSALLPRGRRCESGRIYHVKSGCLCVRD